jgi:hypothetical protein
VTSNVAGVYELFLGMRDVHYVERILFSEHTSSEHERANERTSERALFLAWSMVYFEYIHSVHELRKVFKRRHPASDFVNLALKEVARIQAPFTP